MDNIENTPAPIAPLGLLEQLEQVEDAGILHLRGYRNSEIAAQLGINQNRVKSLIEEYIAIIHNKADNDPYFMERVGYNTIKHLNELDDISKEAWETVEIATVNGMVGSRVQALKLALDITTKKAQLHQLLGSTKSTDADYLTRMQKAESVNQALSRVLKDVVVDCDRCREKIGRAHV